ncbi:glycosyltransferase family 90 protein [Xylariomycetidae sp. FL0641]|nr:glycosyltransferase family 90 protein [Xylariomycetidae sp. FL0641]
MLSVGRLRDWHYELSSKLTGSRGHSAMLRYTVLAFAVSVFLSAVFLFRMDGGFLSRPDYHHFDFPKNEDAIDHPINRLIEAARDLQTTRLKERSFDVATAAARYREARGRHPPPGFDAWFQYASRHDSIVVESFFDRIYADLAPFWALDPRKTATKASSWEHVVRVRKGKAEGVGNTEGRVPWLQLWTALVEEAAPYLPDVDMPINYMDETRLLVPWENVTDLVEVERSSRAVQPSERVVIEYSGLRYLDYLNTTQESEHDAEWEAGNYWNFTRACCPPDAPSRHVSPIENFTAEYPSLPKGWTPDYMQDGFVRNFTAAMDPCNQPHLRGMHGTFVEPITMSTSKELRPLFGGCKLPTNNDILIPGAMYLTDDQMYSGGDSHGPPWKEKKDGLVWRGVASGGRNKKENWTHFQRHRLIEMLNGTTVSEMEEQSSRAPTFEMPSEELYHYSPKHQGAIGSWLKDFADAGFTELLCFPWDSHCDYVEPYFSVVDRIPMKEQYGYKFMPDVDGNSFSARFRGFLLSTSLPIKATLYAEWHDDRLVPWLHFVPMDNSFQDLYAILDYFTRDAAGDEQARFLAEQGRKWGMEVLRREDMLLYVWRLLLEFARVCDDNREWLGYVDDLTSTQKT